MRAAALSFTGASFTTRQGFLDYVYNSISPAADGKQFLLVFPAHLSLLLALRCGDLDNPPDFAAAVSTFLKLPRPGGRNFWRYSAVSPAGCRPILSPAAL